MTVIKVSKSMEAVYKFENQVLDAAYKALPVGKEMRDYSSKKLMAHVEGNVEGTSKGKMDAALSELVRLGILHRTMEYGLPANGMDAGRHYHWTLMMSHVDAIRTLQEDHEQRRRIWIRNRKEANKKGGAVRSANNAARRANPPVVESVRQMMTTESEVPINVSKARETMISRGRASAPEPDDSFGVALAKRDGEETRAIAGSTEERLRPAFRAAGVRVPDEPEALVAAARQYVGRDKALRDKIGELQAMAEELGMSFDAEKMAQSVDFRVDERLEDVALVLPVIDRLERVNERLGKQIAEQTEKLKGYDQLRVENGKLRTQNERLLQAKVSATSPTVDLRT